MSRIREYAKRISKSVYTQIPNKHRKEFEAELLEENYSRLSIVSIILLLIMLFLYSIEDKLFHTGPIILAFIIVCVVLIPQILYIKKHTKTVSRIYALAVLYAYALCTLLYAVSVVLYVQSKADIVHLYLMMVFGTSLFFYIKPVPSAIMFTSVYLCFVLLLPCFQADADLRFVISINTMAFNVFAWMQSRLALRSKLSIFLNKKLLNEKNSMLEELAKRDSMSGLYNHAVSFELLREEIEKCKRMGHPLSLVITDIDDFKKLNDQHGHLAGDHTIKIISQAIKDTVRDTDIVGRYGGEEFIIIMPETNLSTAVGLIKIMQFNIASVQGKTKVTLSGGISQYDGETLNEFIRKTDEKLYLAKRNGKNRFEIM